MGHGSSNIACDEHLNPKPETLNSDIACDEHWLSPHMYGRVWYYSYAGDLKCAGL